MQILEQLQNLIPMLKRSWWLIALTTLLALTLSLLASLEATPVYRTSATFLISPNALLDRPTDQLKALELLDDRVLAATYAEILKSGALYERMLLTLQRDPNVPEEGFEGYSVDAVVLPEASVVELFVEGPDPRVAAFLADNIGQQGVLFFQGQYGAHSIQFLDRAPIPSDPISPVPARDALVAIVLGLAVGAMLAIAYEQFRLLAGHRSELGRDEASGQEVPDVPMEEASTP